MDSQTRRQFMASSAATAGLLALGTDRLLAGPAPEQTEMIIARWAGPKENLDEKQIAQIATRLTEQTLEALGGLKRFVKKGDVVWVKPNIAWDRKPELAANTNPAVVATLVRLCFAAGAKAVKMGDNPCDVAKNTYVSSGIAEAAKEAGAEVLYLDRSRFKSMDIKGERVKQLPLCPEILDCDLVINVPLVKHHVLANATMCMKNYMGVMEERRMFHQDLPTCITDITRFMLTRWTRPQIHILDAVRILPVRGPRGGNLADVQAKLTLAAGVDIVALDAFGAELMGKKPAEIGTIVKGEKAGLGKIDYRALALREISVT